MPTTASAARCFFFSISQASAGWRGGDTTLTCQEFDLNGEGAFHFEDLGDTFCGCPEASGPCQLLSAGLSPPPPLDGGQ